MKHGGRGQPPLDEPCQRLNADEPEQRGLGWCRGADNQRAGQAQRTADVATERSEQRCQSKTTRALAEEPPTGVDRDDGDDRDGERVEAVHRDAAIRE